MDNSHGHIKISIIVCTQALCHNKAMHSSMSGNFCSIEIILLMMLNTLSQGMVYPTTCTKGMLGAEVEKNCRYV